MSPWGVNPDQRFSQAKPGLLTRWKHCLLLWMRVFLALELQVRAELIGRDRVIQPVCGDNLTVTAGHLSQKTEEVLSTQNCDTRECQKCVYFIHAPSNEQTIALNFTHIYGFQNSTGKCLPKVDILEWDRETGQKVNMASICKENNNLHTPQSFHSHKASVKLTYIWPHGQDHCGFQMEYSFHVCAAKCDNGNCLSSPHLLCNGQVNCEDGSDESEQNCKAAGKTTSPTLPVYEYTSSEFLTVVIVVSVVVSVLLTLTMIGLLSYFNRLPRCSIMHIHTPGVHRGGRHDQLRPHIEQPGSGVIYLPGPGNEDQNRHDNNRQQTDLNKQERQIRNLTMNLPPSIPISLDGEEGYDHRYPYFPSASRVESVCPPPNRTIFDGESPPPYRSHSVGRLDRPNNRAHTGILGSSRGSNRDCSESPRVERCYSMSNNNKPTSGGGMGGGGLLCDHHLPRRTRHSTGHSPNGTSTPSSTAAGHALLHGPPPGYDDVILADYHNVGRPAAGAQL